MSIRSDTHSPLEKIFTCIFSEAEPAMEIHREMRDCVYLQAHTCSPGDEAEAEVFRLSRILAAKTLYLYTDPFPELLWMSVFHLK